jgi:quinol monooxygenase YgiN
MGSPSSPSRRPKVAPRTDPSRSAAARRATLAEEGCINYDMHRSVEDLGPIMFHENWTSRPLWERHMESPHLEEFSANTDDIVEVWELFQGEKVDGA